MVDEDMSEFGNWNVATGGVVSGGTMPTSKGSEKISYASMAAKDPIRSGKFPLGSKCWNDVVVVLEEDYTIYINDLFPSIQFSDRVHYQIDKNMRNTMIIRLLGWSIGSKTLQTCIFALWKPLGNFHLINLESIYFLVRFEKNVDFTKGLTEGP
ncbi:hypothetical protein GQ457_01G023880 [Hibiscus cannabinus]